MPITAIFDKREAEAMKKSRSILIAVLAIGLLGVPAIAAQYTNVSESFSVGAGGNLNVAVDRGDIRIRTGHTGVSVEAVGIDEREREYLKIYQDSSTVFVEFDPPAHSRSEPRFSISVPSEFNVVLSTAGGDIQITGNLTGTIEGKTAGGDVSMDDVSGNVMMKTAGGDIEIGVAGGEVRLTTAGGDITMGAADGNVQVTTAGGDITVGDVGNDLDAKTAGGDIETGNIGGSAKVRTAGGDVEVGEVYASAELTTAGGDIDLQGANGTVKAKTAGGDLRLRKVTGSIDGKTSGGDIVAELDPQAPGPSELKTAGGDIRLSLPASANVSISAVIKIRGNWEEQLQDVEVVSDFPGAEVVRSRENREVRADFSVGSGGEEIVLETVNGNIYIRKMDALR
jgi:DUF4097 and DUF4098 domain-containing protein YvlB